MRAILTAVVFLAWRNIRVKLLTSRLGRLHINKGQKVVLLNRPIEMKIVYIYIYHLIFHNFDEMIICIYFNCKPFIIPEFLQEKLCKSIRNYNLRHLHNYQHQNEDKYLLLVLLKCKDSLS